jgi:hypothetical protein
MSITEAKRELFNELKSAKGVTGAGIKEKNGSEYIVIYLTKPRTQLSVRIPSSYKGNKVITMVTKVPKAM